MIERIKRLLSGGFVAPVRGVFRGRMFEQADGSTDLSRILGSFCVLAFLAYQGYATVGLKQSFDPSAFGTGCAALLAGSGVFILAHDKATH